MSYILDALRKSDQQRQRRAAPTLLTPQQAPEAPKQRTTMIYGLFAAVLIGAGMVIGWMRPWQPEQPSAVTEPVILKPLESGARQTEPERVPASPEMSRKPEQERPVRKPASTGQGVPAPAGNTVNRHMPGLAKTEMRNGSPEAATGDRGDAATSAREKPIGAALSDAAQEQKVMTLADLPVSIQGEIPRMSITVHAYSGNPKDRLVGINDRLLRQGDSLEPGLALEQITPEGMIFSYKGFRFSRNVR